MISIHLLLWELLLSQSQSYKVSNRPEKQWFSILSGKVVQAASLSCIENRFKTHDFDTFRNPDLAKVSKSAITKVFSILPDFARGSRWAGSQENVSKQQCDHLFSILSDSPGTNIGPRGLIFHERYV